MLVGCFESRDICLEAIVVDLARKDRASPECSGSKDEEGIRCH